MRVCGLGGRRNRENFSKGSILSYNFEPRKYNSARATISNSFPSARHGHINTDLYEEVGRLRRTQEVTSASRCARDAWKFRRAKLLWHERNHQCPLAGWSAPESARQNYRYPRCLAAWMCVWKRIGREIITNSRSKTSYDGAI
jgi:hypothetical protein